MSAAPLRVLHVIPAVAARYGGPSQAVIALCAALASRGLDVMLASTDADGPGRLTVPIGEPTQYAGVKATFFPRRWSETFKCSPALARWLRRSVGSFDVVHLHAVFSHSSLAAARQCQAQGIPYVLRPLGSLAPWGLERKRWRKSLLMRFVGRRMVERAAAIHYTTRVEQELAGLAIGAARGVVVPLGIDDDLLRAPVPPGDAREPLVLALGRLHPVKNIESVIAAFHRVSAAPGMAAWRLVIAGDGAVEYRRSLEQLASSGPGHDRIDFAGWLEAGEKRAWLRRAALLVQASHQENFGVSIVEAMACGVPAIVAPGVNLAREIERAGAGWVSDGTVAGLEQVLHSAMADAGDRASRARAARGFAGGFTWAAAAEALERVYERVRVDGARPADAGVAAAFNGIEGA